MFDLSRAADGGSGTFTDIPCELIVYPDLTFLLPVNHTDPTHFSAVNQSYLSKLVYHSNSKRGSSPERQQAPPGRERHKDDRIMETMKLTFKITINA